MKKLMLAVAVLATLSYANAEDADGAPEGTKKVTLKLACCETATTRSGKWNPPAQPLALKDKPFSEADIQGAAPDEAARMVRENREVQRNNLHLQKALALRQYQDAMNHYKGMKAKLEGTAFGKQVLVAVDKFAGIAGETFDSDLIEFYHTMDAVQEGEEAKFLANSKEEAEIMVAPYFIKLIFDDPRVQTQQATISGTEMRRTTVTIKATFEVQALSGRIITSGPVTGEKSVRETASSPRTGDESALIGDALEAALTQAAQKINNFFVGKVKIAKVTGPKGDKEFDADSATVLIDGESHDVGEEFSLLNGKHKITTDYEGYKIAGENSFTLKAGAKGKPKELKIKFKKDAKKKAAADEE